MSELHAAVVRFIHIARCKTVASRIIRKFLRYAAPALMVLLFSSFLFATFGTSSRGVVTVLSTGGVTLNTPNGIAVDTQGNVYIADTVNNQVVEVDAFGTTSVLGFPGLSPALNLPTAVAIDGSGNIYVADAGNARVVQLAAGVASVVGLGSATVSSPDGLAVDASGNLYIADAALSRIVEVSGGAASVLSITGLSTALHSPAGLAVDPSGNLYIADAGNNRIVTVATGGAGTVLNITGGLTLSMPLGVAVDRVGNVYIADTSNSRVVTVAPGGTPTVLFTNTVTLLQSAGVAVSVGGAIYIADSGNSRVVEAQPTAAGFGHVQLGASSGTTLALNLTVGFGVTLGSVQVFTQGTAALDFTEVSSGTTCIAGVTNAACVENVIFLPTAPGLRRGSVVLFDNSSPPVPILSVPLYGFSDSPVAALAPNTGSVISTGGLATSNPFQLALDGTGNMYVADYTGKNVTKIPAGGGSASLVNLGTPGGTAMQNITGVALDGAGNLFVGDHQNSRIIVMTPGGVVSVLSINGLSPALGFPVSLVFDEAGNLYIADFTMGRVVEVSSLVVAGSTSSGQATVIGTGSFSFTGSSLTGATVDSEGTIYTAARTQNGAEFPRHHSRYQRSPGRKRRRDGERLCCGHRQQPHCETHDRGRGVGS